MLIATLIYYAMNYNKLPNLIPVLFFFFTIKSNCYKMTLHSHLIITFRFGHSDLVLAYASLVLLIDDLIPL